jgi:hypothetical protein
MVELSELLRKRASLGEKRDKLAAARTSLQDVEARLTVLTSRRDFAAADSPDRVGFELMISVIEVDKGVLVEEVGSLQREITALEATHESLVAEENALWRGAAAKHPVALFPVRIETRFAEPASGGGVDLLLRVYPDDVHVPAAPKQMDEASPGNIERAGGRVRLLPHHWTAYAFRGDELMFEQSGAAIATDLPASLAVAPAGVPADGLDIRRWLIDFDVAVKVGMAMRIHLEDADPVIDQLFVLGVNAETSARKTAEQIEAVFAAHAASRSLGFLSVGAQTNNTAQGRAAWSASEPAPEGAPAGKFKPKSAQNAAAMARAFAVDGRENFALATGALDDQDTPIRTMMDCLFTALTFDFLENLFTVRTFEAGGSSAASVPAPTELTEQLHDYTTRFLRSRGPLPTLRVGRQPYGVLPVSSCELWTADDDLERLVLGTLRDMRMFFEAGLLNVPRKTGNTDQDETILNLLARRPLSSDVLVRSAGELDTPDGSIAPFVIAPSPRWDAEINMNGFSGTAEPLPAALPLVGDAAALARRFAQTAAVLRAHLTPDGLKQLQQDIWATHMNGAPAPQSADDLPEEAKASMRGTNSLLNVLLHQSIQFDGSVFSDLGTLDPEEARRRVAAFMIGRMELLAGRLEAMAATPPEQYQRLLLETLDVYSHRYDAWVTSLVARRLEKLRGARASGCHVGGYGWIEDLRRDPPQQGESPAVEGFDRVRVDPTQTYVLAPSLHHATTAAVLRAGFESHSDPEAFAVKLTSRRARTARWLLEGVRNGQTLGALLGYRFERGLHDRGLDARIDDFRALFPVPLVTAHDAPEAAAASESIAAENVVDGLALHRGAAGISADLSAGIEDLLTELADAIDSVGDLMLAESVHQLVGGNPLRAGLAADTLGRGESIPDRFDVLRTPQSARALTCRVAVMLPADFSAQSRGWSDDRPRARLSPELDGWVAHLLGDARQWAFEFAITDAAGTRTVSCSLDQLDLCPLDVVFEAGAAGASPDGLLYRRLVEHVLADHADAQARLSPAEPGVGSFDTLAAWAASIRALFAGASPLMPDDIGPADPATARHLDMKPLAARATRFLRELKQSLQAMRDALSAVETAASDAAGARADAKLADSMSALAAFGVQAGYPIAGGGVARLEQARSVAASLEALALPAEIAAPPADADELTLRGWLEQTAKLLRTLLGESFPVLPMLAVTAQSELAQTLVVSARPEGADPATTMGWLGRLSALRPAVRHLYDGLASAEMLGIADTESLVVTQAPVPVARAGRPREPWIALPFGERARPAAQRTLVAHTPKPIRIGTGETHLCGLIVDRWVEHLPGLDALGGIDRAAIGAQVQQALRTGAPLPAALRDIVEELIAARVLNDEHGAPIEDLDGLSFSADVSVDVDSLTHAQSEIAGLSFRYDQPDAQAPQAILLAVPPDTSRPWSESTLLQVVRDTLDLAKLRAVELRDLPRMTPLLPATYVDLNARQLPPVTVTTPNGSFLSTPNEIDEWNSMLVL